jgi:3-dehydroquinate synthase
VRELNLVGATGASRILIGASLRHLGDYVDRARAVLIVDDNVARLHPRLVAGFSWIDAGSGESAKSLQNIERICRRLLELGADRSTFVVGVGGGVACDLAGFAASIFMRGLDFGFAPTSLLAQVDASIGGKNGVNLDGYKNILGVFNQPRFVLVDFDVLRTLAPREVLCGAAEIVKHALIGDPDLFATLEQNGGRLLALEPDAVEEAVVRSITLKASVVSADEREAGERRKLNFGHTLAHALEKTSRVSHGEGVAMGMVFAARVSAARGLLSPADEGRIEALIRGLGLPADLPAAAGPLVEAVWKDKKREGETIHFVLLAGISRAVVVRLTRSELERHIHDLCQPR